MIKKWMRPITKAAYFMGVVFLLTGMLLSAVNLPVQAGSQSAPEAKRRCPIIQTDTACTIKNSATEYVYTIKNNYSDADAKYNTINDVSTATLLTPGSTATIKSSSNSLTLYVWEYGLVWHNGYDEWVRHEGYWENGHWHNGYWEEVHHDGYNSYDLIWSGTKNLSAPSNIKCTIPPVAVSGLCIGTNPYQAQWSITQNDGNNDIKYKINGGSSVSRTAAIPDIFTTNMGTPPQDKTIDIYVKGEKVASATILATSCQAPPVHNIVVSGSCVQGSTWGTYQAQWNVTANALNDSFTYSALPGPYSGSGSGTGLLPNQDLGTSPVNQTLTISAAGLTFTGTMDASKCTTWKEPTAPTLSGSCSIDVELGKPYVITWTVTNNDTTYPISYTYGSSTETIGVGGSSTFYTESTVTSVSVDWTWAGNPAPKTLGPVAMTGSCPTITVTPNKCAVGSTGKTYTYDYSSSEGEINFRVSEDGQTGKAKTNIQSLTSNSSTVTLLVNGYNIGAQASGTGLKCTPVTVSGQCTGSYPNYQANWTLTNTDGFGYSWTVTGDGGNTYPSVALPATTTIEKGINEVVTVTWTDSTGEHTATDTVDYYADCTQPQADIVAGSCYTQDTSGTVYYKFTYTANVPFIIQGEPGTTYPAGTGEIIRNNPKVTIVYGDNKTDEADATNMICSYQPIAILSGKCTGSYPNYKAEWTVNNPDHIAFTWLATVGETGSSSSVDSHTSFISNFSLYTDEKATISWVDAGGNHTSAEVTASFSGCKLPTLTVTPKCYINSDATTQQIQWLVTSTDYTGSNIKYGSTPVTLGTAFYVPASVGAITVTYDDVNNVTGSAIPTDLAPCGKTLTLTAGQCSFVEGSYRVDWTVTNPNEFNVPFGWTSNNPTGNGSGTAALNNTASFNVPYSGTGTLTVGVSAFGAVSPASQTITPACPKITVVPPQDMTICSLTATSFIPKFTATYENISTDGASLVITSSLNPGVPATTSFTGSAVNQTVAAQQANWAGIGDGLTPFTFTWDYLVYLSGTQVGSGTVTYSYDAQSDQELCQQPQELLILDPYCTIYNGDWAMAWEVKNPNPWAVPFSWVLDGDGAHAKSATAAASAMTPLEFISLGDAHMVNISWTDGKGIAHTASLTDETKKCETPKEPTPESTPQTFLIPVTGAQPTLAAPQTEGALLIPVTGADYQPIQFGGAFFTNLYTHLGLFFVGLALVFTGIQKKFLK